MTGPNIPRRRAGWRQPAAACCVLACLAVRALPAFSQFCQPPPAGLTSWWRAEGTADDLIGGNAGVLVNGATYAAGKVGQAFLFNGTNSHVLVPSSPNLKFTGPFSIEAWVKYDQLTDAINGGCIVAKGIDQNTPLDWALMINSEGKLRPHANLDGSWDYFDCDTVLSPQVWHQVAMVYDGAHLKGYVDGAPDGSVNVSGTVQASDRSVRIGLYSTTGGGGSEGGGPLPVAPFAGSIDELSLYNRALSASEITAIYTASSAGKCATPAPPTVVLQPADQTVYAGANVFLTAGAVGATPLSYQWQFNTTNISGATNTLLVLTNVPQSSNGNYRVLVTGPGGSTNSSNAVLTINPAPSCQSAPSGIVSWWPGEGTADDLIGGNAGILRNGATFAPGEVGTAFSFDGTNGYVEVPGGPNLKFSGPFSIEAWVNYDRQTDGNGDTIVAKGVDQLAPLDWALVVGTGGQLTPLVNAGGGWHYFACDTVLSPHVWHHVAMVYDGTNLQGYVNGALDGSVPVSGTVQTSDTTMKIGTYAAGTGYAMFAGQVDELAVYNRALSSNEIQTIYNASSVGKCKTPAAPTVMLQPSNQTVYAGANVIFNASATGATPLSYQWQFNTTNIAGATNALLVLTNLPQSSNGNYRVLVTGPGGSTNSSNAVLTVNPAPPCQPAPSGIVSWWPGEGTADDLIGGNAGILRNGATFAPGEVGGAFSFDGTNGYVEVPANDNLKFSGPFSAEAWINYDRLTGYNGADILAKGPDQDAAIDWALTVSSDGRLRPHANLDGGWNYFDCNTALSAGVWYHVALVYDGSHLQGYVNGALDGSIDVTGAVQTSDSPLRIGAYAPLGAGPAAGSMFAGRLDELAVYNRALSSNEIQAIYSLSSVGKCKTPAAPMVITQPADQIITAGDNVTFSVASGGATPLSYQWQFNHVNIDGATNALFSLTNTPASREGLYRVVVSNAVNSIVSSNALLTVQRLSPQFDTSPGSIQLTTNGLGLRLLDLSGHGPVVISASSNLVTWQPIFTNPPVLGTLLFLDPAATNFPTRYYKAVEQ